MPLDAIAVSCLKTEFNRLLSGGKVEKIYQPERDEIAVVIKTRADRFRLVISADSSNPCAYISDASKQNPLSAPLFCMLLRKHLSGGVLESVTGTPYERVMDFTFTAYNELGDKVVRRITAELMGRFSNIILTDEEGRIVDCVRRVDLTVSSVRCLLPGLFYEQPPAHDKVDPSVATHSDIFTALLSVEGDVRADKAIVRLFAGMSPLAAKEITFRATGDTDTPLTAANAKIIADELFAFFEKINNNDFSPCLLMDSDGRPADFAAYDVGCYGNLYKVIKFDSISATMEEFYRKRDLIERMRQKSAALRKTASNLLERHRRKLAIQQETLAGAADNEKYRLYGEILTANLYKGETSSDSITLDNFYENNAPIVIPLDTSKTLSQNAQIYFTRYRKAKTAEKMATEQIKINTQEIEYIESVLAAIDNAETTAELSEIRTELVSGGYIRETGKKQKPVAAAPLKLMIDGYEVYIGKNNRQNDYVTFKIGRSEDIWLHAKDMPGSHALIKTMRDTPTPDSVIEKVACHAAFYSKGRTSPFVSIDYTAVKNVKKPPGAKPGMVIYTNYKTAYVKPTEPNL